MTTRPYASLFATLVLAAASVACASAAATPSPHARAVPTPPYPKTKLHTEFVVEVNKMGQVVRMKSGKSCPDLTFNAQTYGNAMQMWIRHPDGSAQVGLYRVTYDYDPKTHDVHRAIALVSRGGAWANTEGAANRMIDIAHKETLEAQKHTQGQNASLPPLDQIIKPSPAPTKHP